MQFISVSLIRPCIVVPYQLWLYLVKRVIDCLLRYLQPIPDLEFVKPPLACNEVIRRSELNGLLFDHLGSDRRALLLHADVPLIKLFFHIRVLSFTASTLFSFPSNLHPTLQALKRNIIGVGTCLHSLLLGQLDCFVLDLRVHHFVLGSFPTGIVASWFFSSHIQGSVVLVLILVIRTTPILLVKIFYLLMGKGGRNHGNPRLKISRMSWKWRWLVV